MYIHAGIDKTETATRVMYRVERSLMVGDFQRAPSKDDVRTFRGVDRDTEANAFYRGLYAAAFVVREAEHMSKLKVNLGTEGNSAP